ncbi:hypothetical protein [Rickettsiales endosymbiont of Stachyamoeba lipophora]|uniref:hypothetical protein n=1 Tax=Rickettsiales endosymbiont of Stachyamoeba lipophora TaxID=2486578 RepID=UPI000F650187|nr:hypothetical protein [Rickettsiales endosymbiont of Stachyamoeba lipophora]AZL15758.1 hypothetical protein EF513_04255 [Rickettsiales endosymbiont of Stachyamoeba lipophora]
MPRGPFKLLFIKQLFLKNRNQKLYRMYNNNKEFVEIEAPTVYEAIDKSENKKPNFIRVIIKRLEGIIPNASFLTPNKEEGRVNTILSIDINEKNTEKANAEESDQATGKDPQQN